MGSLRQWLCCTGKQSCESRSGDHIGTYQTRKERKYGPSAQEYNTQHLLNPPHLLPFL